MSDGEDGLGEEAGPAEGHLHPGPLRIRRAPMLEVGRLPHTALDGETGAADWSVTVTVAVGDGPKIVLARQAARDLAAALLREAGVEDG